MEIQIWDGKRWSKRGVKNYSICDRDIPTTYKWKRGKWSPSANDNEYFRRIEDGIAIEPYTRSQPSEKEYAKR